MLDNDNSKVNTFILSAGIAVQPILTIPLGQAGVQGSSSLVNPLVPLHHLQHQGPHPQHTGNNVCTKTYVHQYTNYQMSN